MSFFEKKAGPTLVTPRAPKPYLSCDDCLHFHQTRTTTGGQHGAPLYSKACHHPKPIADRLTSLNKNFKGDPEGNTVTPDWCPCLKENK